MAYQGSFGLHFAIHQPGWVDRTALELLSLAEQAAATGVERIWVNDNFKARHTYSLLSAMATRVPCALGTLVTYPYARNPMDMATAFGTIAELSGKELAVGISTGAWAIQGRLVDQPSPTQSVQEAMEISRRLLAGEEVRFDRYPLLASYFHIHGDATFRLRFRTQQRVSFWIPPKGPRMLQLAAEQCDGVIFNSYTQYAALPFVRDGTLERTIHEMERMRTASGNLTPLRRIFKIDLSLDEDGDTAKKFARNFVSFNAADDAERYRSLGLPSDQLNALQDRYGRGAEIAEAAPLVGKELLDWVVLAGTPNDVCDRFAEYVDCADRLGFEQVILAVPLGPDPRKAVALAGELLGRMIGKPQVCIQLFRHKESAMPAPYPSIAIPKRLLMGPGPSEVDPRVYQAMTQPVVGYLDGVLLRVMDEIHAMLRTVFCTQNAATFPLPGTGSAGMEASLINFIEPGDDVAVVVGGTFAARMCEMVERCGGKLLRIDHRPGTIADPDQVRQAVRGKKLKVLATVHSETSTGICQPLEPLKQIAQEAGALLVVDAVSSLGGLPLKVDEWGLDVCYSGSQKCLACPPGLAPITIAESAREVLRRRQRPVQSWYLDLSMVEKYWSQERRYHHTPPVSMLYALHEALRVVLEDDLEAVWARHQQCHRAFVQGVEAMGLKMFVEDPAARAWTVNTIRVPDGVEDARVRAALTERFGIEIATGIGDLRGKIWRVGLMGRTARPELVLLLLNALESALNDNGFPCPRGTGVAAAEKELQVSVK